MERSGVQYASLRNGGADNNILAVLILARFQGMESSLVDFFNPTENQSRDNSVTLIFVYGGPTSNNVPVE